ncbi:MAG: hypothetical protein PHQ72_05955 [Hespellia sp.]|nr:hypothetical protein [Hespellia sp.]
MSQENIYGEKLIKIPTPKYIVFYNGTDACEDRVELRLSDAFEHPDGCMEFTAVMLNINLGHNKVIMNQCKLLEEYATFIEQIRVFQGEGFELDEAIDMASEYCIEHDVLREFLLKNRNEVRQLILTEYDEKKQRALDRRDARAEGRAEGKAEGSEEERIKIALKLREQGISMDVISVATGLTEDEIRALDTE